MYTLISLTEVRHSITGIVLIMKISFIVLDGGKVICFAVQKSY
jgi:hypothetical protein